MNCSVRIRVSKRIIFSLTTSIALLASVAALAQREIWYEKTPKGMAFVPMGTFEMEDSIGKRSVSLPPFWVSSEISNKEYREFTDDALAHPNKVLSWVQLVNDNQPITMYTGQPVTMDDILQAIAVDSMALAKEYEAGSEEYKKYSDYFTNKKFDRYPVVGVTYDGALYYCIWKTITVNEERKAKGEALVYDYRLPMLEEFLYLMKNCRKKELASDQEIRHTTFYKNEKVYFNVSGNVSEWICVPGTGSEKKVFGTPFTNPSAQPVSTMDRNSRNGHTGFRVVRSYGKQKQ